MIHKDAIMTTLYFDNRESHKQSCEVRIDGNEIVIDYRYVGDPKTYTYRGVAQAPGHWVLNNAGVQNGSATLHRLAPDAVYLNGYWKEGRDQGMWRIEIR
jgi:hypothetical protein